MNIKEKKVKISELIEFLQERMDVVGGDQEVYVYNTEHNTLNAVDFVCEKWRTVIKPEGY